MNFDLNEEVTIYLYEKKYLFLLLSGEYEDPQDTDDYDPNDDPRGKWFYKDPIAFDIQENKMAKPIDLRKLENWDYTERSPVNGIFDTLKIMNEKKFKGHKILIKEDLKNEKILKYLSIDKNISNINEIYNNWQIGDQTLQDKFSSSKEGFISFDDLINSSRDSLNYIQFIQIILSNLDDMKDLVIEDLKNINVEDGLYKMDF